MPVGKKREERQLLSPDRLFSSLTHILSTSVSLHSLCILGDGCVGVWAFFSVSFTVKLFSLGTRSFSLHDLVQLCFCLGGEFASRFLFDFGLSVLHFELSTTQFLPSVIKVTMEISPILQQQQLIQSCCYFWKWHWMPAVSEENNLNNFPLLREHWQLIIWVSSIISVSYQISQITHRSSGGARNKKFYPWRKHQQSDLNWLCVVYKPVWMCTM